MRRLALLGLGFHFLCAAVTTARADDVDDLIASRMRERRITGLSLAIIEKGRIARAEGYGFADKDTRTPVTSGTLFQAGSVSKSVAALGALHLVEEGRLSLDADVNTELLAWKVPENRFTRQEKVTLRRILNHNAGLTVHSFAGYSRGSPVPTLVEVLDGAKPANSSPIRVDIVPGSQWRYSGGGYTVMQQMTIDATGKPFPEFLGETVLRPLGMTNSTYEQPLPESMAALAATAYRSDGTPVAGRWHVYPEMAAAGLWTTASDLARFAIGIQRSLAGTSSPVISQDMTRVMLTDQKNQDGLGVFLVGSGGTALFHHEGRNLGFDTFLMAYASRGRGVAIMMNANDDSGAAKDIFHAVAKEYGWITGP